MIFLIIFLWKEFWCIQSPKNTKSAFLQVILNWRKWILVDTLPALYFHCHNIFCENINFDMTLLFLVALFVFDGHWFLFRASHFVSFQFTPWRVFSITKIWNYKLFFKFVVSDFKCRHDKGVSSSIIILVYLLFLRNVQSLLKIFLSNSQSRHLRFYLK